MAQQVATLGDNTVIYNGAATTRQACVDETGANALPGSLYISSAGKVYLKVANAGANTDWQKVSSTAAD